MELLLWRNTFSITIISSTGIKRIKGSMVSLVKVKLQNLFKSIKKQEKAPKSQLQLLDSELIFVRRRVSILKDLISQVYISILIEFFKKMNLMIQIENYSVFPYRGLIVGYYTIQQLEYKTWQTLDMIPSNLKWVDQENANGSVRKLMKKEQVTCVQVL